MKNNIPPGLRNLFLLHSIVAMVFGLMYLLYPQAWGSLGGMDISEPVMYRFLGAALLGYGISSWLAFRAETWDQVRIVVQMELAWTVLGALVALYALLFNDYPAIGWLNATLLMAFAVAFAWFYFRR